MQALFPRHEVKFEKNRKNEGNDLYVYDFYNIICINEMLHMKMVYES